MCAEVISFNAELSPPIYGLPSTMQRMIREVSDKRQAAIDFALGPALGAASIAIGSRITLNAYGYSNRLNLWIMMIGRSTANKTAPMKDIYAPLYKINNRLFDEYSAKVEAVKAERATGNDKPLPKTSQILIEDSTPEARNQALEDNPHGLLNSREELTATIGDIGRYGSSGELSALLSLRDCTPFTTNRKGEGLKVIKAPFYSWVSGIQPGMLKPTFDNPKFLSMGFLNRFLAFYPTEMPKRTARKSPEAVTIDLVIAEAWDKLICDTYNNVATSVITASGSAIEVYCRFVENSIRADEASATDYEASIWGKLRIYVLQLAGIACVMNAIEQGKQPAVVTAEQMSWAVDMAYYSQASQLRMLTDIIGSTKTTPQLTNKELLLLLESRFPHLIKSKLAEAIGVDPRQVRRWLNG